MLTVPVRHGGVMRIGTTNHRDAVGLKMMEGGITVSVEKAIHVDERFVVEVLSKYLADLSS